MVVNGVHLTPLTTIGEELITLSHICGAWLLPI